MPPKYPRQKVIAVDVDGTLFRNGAPDEKLIAWCRARKLEGFSLLLWSSGGEDYARRAAEKSETVALWSHIISKPGYIVDDQGWSWVKFTGIVRRLYNGI